MTTDTYILDSNHIGDTVGPNDTFVPGETSVKGMFRTAKDDTFIGPETTIGSSTVFDTARLAGSVILNQKKRVVTITRNAFLITSGLVLGVVIALTASSNSDPVAVAATFHTEKTIALPQAPKEERVSEEQGLEIEPRLKELETWFQEQPVPVSERVFLHNAEASLRSKEVEYQAPIAVHSRYNGITGKPVGKSAANGSQGRYATDAKDGVEWQGDFKASKPSENHAKAAKYVAEIEAKFGEDAAAHFKHVTRSVDGSLKSTTQRSFGPKVD